MKKIFFLINALCIFICKFSHAEIQQDYAKIYQLLANEYLHDFSYKNFTCTGLHGLKKIDRDLNISCQLKFLQVSKAKEKQSFLLPDENAPAENWAELVVKAVNYASSISDQLKLKDFLIFDTINDSAFKGLDEYSRYIASIEDEDNNIQIKKYFAAKNIDDILYIKLKTFNRLTFYKVKKALSENMSAKGLIIDLRGNHGGMLSEAIDVADLFLEKGTVIVSTQTKNSSAKQMFVAKTGDFWMDKPIAVLVDENTASSAEMLTAALKEQGRAKVVGTLTYGKGTVQNLKIIADDKGIILTNAYFYSPHGGEINHNGIIPDVCTFLQDNICTRANRENNAEDIQIAIKNMNNN